MTILFWNEIKKIPNWLNLSEIVLQIEIGLALVADIVPLDPDLEFILRNIPIVWPSDLKGNNRKFGH